MDLRAARRSRLEARRGASGRGVPRRAPRHDTPRLRRRAAMIQESERDQVESNFTRLLREFMSTDPRYLASIFVDREGECVDYCAVIDPYDAKVAGAHLQVVLGEIRPAIKRLMLGEVEHFVAYGGARDLALRRVDDEYS